MDNDLKNILSESNKDIDNQALLNYLSNSLSAGEKHDIEKKMIEDNFVNDAVEGLQEIQSRKNIQEYVEKLNADLHKHLSKRKKRNGRKYFDNQIWIYIAIVILLSIIVISFIVIKKFLIS